MSEESAVNESTASKKTKSCRWCCSIIDYNAKICSSCQSRQNPIAHYLYYTSATIAMLMVLLTFMQFLETKKQAFAAKQDAEFAQKASEEANVALGHANNALKKAEQSAKDAGVALRKAKTAEENANLAKIDTMNMMFEMGKTQKSILEQSLATIRGQITSTHNTWLTNEHRKNAICSGRGVAPSDNPPFLGEPWMTHWRQAHETSKRLANYKGELEQRAKKLEDKIKNLQ